MEIEISFCVQGHFTQTVKLKDDCKLTAQEIQEQLRSGTLVTTVQEDGTLDITESGKAIGTVTDTTNELEYSDFDVEEA